MEIDEQVKRMLDLVIERKLKLNKINQARCLDNEEDEDYEKCGEDLTCPTFNLEIECCSIE